MSKPAERGKIMLESRVEGKLVREVKRNGGLALKWVCPGVAGVPDRIVLFPGGRIVFVELKRPGGKPRPLQVRFLNWLRKMGFNVDILDTLEGVDIFIEKYVDKCDNR